MPYTLEQLPDEPIIILTYHGHMDVETVKAAFEASSRLAGTMDGHVYRVSDVRQGEGNFTDVMDVIGGVMRAVSGSSADPKIRGVFVGSHQMARLYADFLKQPKFGGVQIPFYHTLDEALAYIRHQIATGES